MKGLLSYYLTPFQQGFIFQITHQDYKVTRFLKEKGSYFTASNGWQVQIEAEPEINIHSKIIYLRGFDSSKDLKVDRTYNIGDGLVNTVISEVNTALHELIKTVKYSKTKSSSKNIPWPDSQTRVNVYEPTLKWFTQWFVPRNLVILD